MQELLGDQAYEVICTHVDAALAGLMVSFDAEIPLPSLPAALGIERLGLPRDVPYLTVPELSRAAWREQMQLAGENGGAQRAGLLRVGFVWAGHRAQQQNVVRSWRKSQGSPGSACKRMPTRRRSVRGPRIAQSLLWGQC